MKILKTDKMPGGVLKFGFGGGVRLTTQNPYPFLGVEIFGLFLGIWPKIGPVFKDFSPKI